MATAKEQEVKHSPQPRNFSWHQDAALVVCQAKHPVCPFGCAKDGAANCDFNVRSLLCAPSRETVEAAATLAALAAAQE